MGPFFRVKTLKLSISALGLDRDLIFSRACPTYASRSFWVHFDDDNGHNDEDDGDDDDEHDGEDQNGHNSDNFKARKFRFCMVIDLIPNGCC